jgi:hypothetical protein
MTTFNAAPPRAIHNLLAPLDEDDSGYDSDELLFVPEKTWIVGRNGMDESGGEEKTKHFDHIITNKNTTKDTAFHTLEHIATENPADKHCENRNAAVDDADAEAIANANAALGKNADFDCVVLDSKESNVLIDDLINCVKVHSCSPVDIEVQLIDPDWEEGGFLREQSGAKEAKVEPTSSEPFPGPDMIVNSSLASGKQQNCPSALVQIAAKTKKNTKVKRKRHISLNYATNGSSKQST